MDDPFKTSEPTIQRPRPGAGRRLAPDPGRQSDRPQPAGAPIPAAARQLIGVGLNPLARAAGPLLILIGQLRGALSAPDIPELRQFALAEIRQFEDAAHAAGAANEIVVSARYALCAAFDEAVLSTPWGAHSEWSQQTMLAALHRETWGGEKFFEILARISGDPARFIDLMELQYLCLAIGFAGKYQVRDDGAAALATVRHELHRRIRDHRGAPEPELSRRWRGLQARHNPLARYLPWWVTAAGALAIVVLAFSFSYARLSSATTPIYEALAGLEESVAAAPVAVAAGPTVLQLLPDEVKNRLQVVEDTGGRTRIILAAADLFAAGSATPNPQYEPLLRQVATVLGQVPGRVRVEGHTDDQPFRSFAYADNFELSRARAANVASQLQRAAGVPLQVESSGLGAARPISNQRPLNRRVEIIHSRGY